MAGSPDDTDLEPVVAAARQDPAFLAGRVSLAGAEQAIAERLNLDRFRVQRLLLCPPPAPSRFAADVTEIARLVGADPELLAVLLREVEAVGGLRGLAGELSFDRSGLLAAARDAEEAHVTLTAGAAEHLRGLAAQFWAGAPGNVRGERDIEAAVTWSMPLAVVVMAPLTLAGIQEWLAGRGIPVAGERSRDRDRVRGFLVAWRGVGMVFCDGTADAGERRFTLAHEVGHFLLDYDGPRRRVLRDVPELLEVVDGLRPATASDRAQALLAGVRIGVHTQLLDDGESSPADRDARGAMEDQASHFALELLAPWEEAVAAIRGLTAATAPYRDILAQATDLITNRFAIPPYAARTRARQALDALGIHRGFFDH